MLPSEAVIEEKGKHRLAVTAYFSDGRQEDITEQVRYESLNEEVVRVSEEGLVEGVGKGEAAVMIRTAGRAAEARFGVIGDAIEEYSEGSAAELHRRGGVWETAAISSDSIGVIGG